MIYFQEIIANAYTFLEKAGILEPRNMKRFKIQQSAAFSLDAGCPA
jgi:hypothetical protein